MSTAAATTSADSSAHSSYKPGKNRLHVIAGKSFALGATISLCITVLSTSANWNRRVERCALYTLCQGVFHSLEFFITAVFNTAQVDDDSFVLGDTDLHMAFAASVAETVITRRFFAYSSWQLVLGLVIVTVGQACRSVAMYTAGVSFNHYIQREHSSGHELVTSGIYHYLRHPSYCGFFWWFVGTQLILQNRLLLLFGSYKLYNFFKSRISYEENILVSFFGDNYIAYRKRAYVGIPFIH